MNRWKDKFYVPSSSGEAVYTVGLSHAGEWACGCIGWTRHVPRKDCKHIRQIKQMVGAPIENFEPTPSATATPAMPRMPTTQFREPPPVIAGRPMRMISLPD